MSNLQVVSAVMDKQGLHQEAEGQIKDAFRALVIERFVERAKPASLPVPTPPVFTKLTVSHCCHVSLKKWFRAQNAEERQEWYYPPHPVPSHLCLSLKYNLPFEAGKLREVSFFFVRCKEKKEAQIWDLDVCKLIAGIFHWQGRRPAVPKPGSEAQNRIDAETERQQPASDYRETRYKLPPELDTEKPGKSDMAS